MPTYHRTIILASNLEFEGKLFKLDYSHTQPNLDIHEPVWAARPDLTNDFFYYSTVFEPFLYCDKF